MGTRELHGQGRFHIEDRGSGNLQESCVSKLSLKQLKHLTRFEILLSRPRYWLPTGTDCCCAGGAQHSLLALSHPCCRDSWNQASLRGCMAAAPLKRHSAHRSGVRFPTLTAAQMLASLARQLSSVHCREPVAQKVVR